MDGELLSLKWNNHRTTFYHVISGLRNKESYTDVTLACDGKFYPAHKFVLSTCSEYFSEIFDRTPCKNPVIVLKDIMCRDLEFLLDYMYIGEVNVRQNELTSLIKAAECLRVKGLAVPDEEPKKIGSGGSVSNSAPQTSSNSGSSSRQRPEQSSPPAKRRKGEERRVTPAVQDQSPGRPPGGDGAPPLGSPDRRDARLSDASVRGPDHPDESDSVNHDTIVIKEEKEDSHDNLVNVQNNYDGGGEDDGDGPHDSEGNTSDFPEFLQSTIEKEEPVAISEFNPDFPGPSGLQNSGLAPWESENNSASFPEGLSGAVAAAVAAVSQPQQRQQQQLVSDGRLAATGMADGDTGPYTCSVCGQVYAGRSQFLLHCATHSPTTVVVRFRCPFCNYGTNDRSNFRRHVTVHTGVKNFRCPHCGRRSNDRSNMKKHVLRCVAVVPTHTLS